MIAWGNTTDRVLLLLQNNELTKIEICSKLGLTHDQVSGVLTRLRRSKRIYICGYTRIALGKRLYLRPLFLFGSKPDKPKPAAFTQKERSAKYHKKKMAVKRAVKLNAWVAPQQQLQIS